MSLGTEPDDSPPTPNAPPRGLRQLEESRRSFRRQVEQLKDIDDKAMRSVRTAAVVIGFVVTAVGITLRTGRVSLGPGPALFTGLGVFFLTVTVVAGVGTSSVTEYRTRLSDAERVRLDSPANAASRQEAELVRIYYSWLDSTEDELSESVALLSATLTALTLGVLSLLTATSLAVVQTVFPLENVSLFRGVLFHIGVVVLVFLGVGLTTKLIIRSVNPYL